MSIEAAFIFPHPPLIIPKIGNGEELRIKNTVESCNKIGRKIAEIAPDLIIFISPHAISYEDYIHISPGFSANGDFSKFGAPGVTFKTDYDNNFVTKLEELCKEAGISAGTMGDRQKELDHGTMVPMYFINKYYSGYNSVRVSISGMPPEEHYRFGHALSLISNTLKRKTVVIASGDLSHKLLENSSYGFDEAGPLFDQKIVETIKSGNFLDFMTMDENFCERAAQCGLNAFIIMSGTLNKKAVKTKLLSYEGPFGVGYAVADIAVTGDDGDRDFELKYNNFNSERIQAVRKSEGEHAALAREALEVYICDNKIISPNGFLLSEDLTKKAAGVFVSLKKNGRLRGCIGTISPACENIAEEIVINAISAGTKDGRFDAVTIEELDKIEYSVDVLGEPELISDISMLDPETYGVIVSKDGKRGLLLPNLTGIDTVSEQLSIALRKASIYPNETYTIQRFIVERFK